uniref:Secreted protein n=1 Tax=Picea glauca TaxID=3330 RepID=A0A101LY39_PICGL|nr:hypothetical protein ABT39_MTgene5646 [Picea glauca]
MLQQLFLLLILILIQSSITYYLPQPLATYKCYCRASCIKSISMFLKCSLWERDFSLIDIALAPLRLF